MYDVSAEYREAIKRAVDAYRLRIKINNTNYDGSIVVGGSLIISNQCSDTDIVQIGSVYTGELKATIDSEVIIRGTWEDAVIEVSEGIRIEGNTWEYVPLGIFRVAEANHTDAGVNITAYDDMLKFDKSWNVSTTIGTPYNIIKLLCDDCGVALGMTRTEIEAMANGTQSVALYSENDCETYRDVLYWITQTLAAFATIGRDGKLYLREYGDTVIDDIDDTLRFENSSFSDFVTEYSSIAYTDIDSQAYKHYVDSGADDKLVYNLGTNPFIQYGTESTKKQMCLNILQKLRKIAYTPFSTEYLNTPAYDLGDCFSHSGGIGDGAVGCVMKYEYKYSEGYKVEGFGANPTLATARNKVDKDIAGLMSRTDKNGIQLYTFKNANPTTIADGEEKQLEYIRFTTMEAKQVTFQSEILVDTEASTDEVVGKIKYYLDGAEVTDYQPTETWTEDGKHIISLYYIIDVEPHRLYQWEVNLESTGGTITVPMEHARGTIWGQGLVAITAWSGFIDAEDTIGAIPLDDIGVAGFTDDMEFALIIPHNIVAEDTIGAISLDDIEVAGFSDVVIINKKSLYYAGKTWDELYSMDWSEVFADWLW